MQTTFAPEAQVKQFVAVMANSHGNKFMVYETGSPKHYLFACVRDGIQTGLSFPVLKSRLRADVRKMLANGCGNATL